MSRAVLAIMAGLLCTVAGFRHAVALKADASRLGRWEQLMRHLTLLLREGTLSIPEALCAAADGHHPPDKLLRTLAQEVHSSPMTTLSQAYAAHSTTCAEQATLTRMFTRLGHGTLESRCLAVEQAAEEIRLLAANAGTKAEKDAKLWQTLGFIGGACLTIMLL